MSLLSFGQLFRPKRLRLAQCVHKGSSRMAREVGHLNGLRGGSRKDRVGLAGGRSRGRGRGSGWCGQRDVWLLTGLCKLHKLGKWAKSVARFCATGRGELRNDFSINRCRVGGHCEGCGEGKAAQVLGAGAVTGSKSVKSQQPVHYAAGTVYLGLSFWSLRLFAVMSIIGLVTRLQLQVLGQGSSHPVTTSCRRHASLLAGRACDERKAHFAASICEAIHSKEKIGF